MKVADLIAHVVKSINDTSFDEPFILGLLNDGLQEVAAGGSRPDGYPLVAPLPDLANTTTITIPAGEATASMPDTFQRGLFMLIDSANEPITLFDSHISFLQKYPGLTETGNITAASLKGRTLHVQGRPASDTDLTAYFYRFPAEMVEDNDVPEGIPPHLHKRTLASYALKEIYPDIERGEDGATPNTIKHENKHFKALNDLEEFIGPEDGVAQFMPDSADYL